MAKKEADLLSRYKSNEEELSNRGLKFSKWYVEHRALFGKIGLGLFIAVAVGLNAFSLFFWAEYLFFGAQRDQQAVLQTAASIADYQSIQSAYAAKDLQVGSTRVVEAAPDRYDFIAHVTNNNERHIGTMTFKYLYAGGETAEQTATILPGQQRPVAVLGHELAAPPSNVRMVVVNTAWNRISPHAIADPEVYMAERDNFLIDEFTFLRKSRSQNIPSHSIQFDITNASAFSYWEGAFLVEFLSGNSVVGIRTVLIDTFRSGDTESIDLRSTVDNLSVSNIRVTPTIHFFDEDEFMPPGL